MSDLNVNDPDAAREYVLALIARHDDELGTAYDKGWFAGWSEARADLATRMQEVINCNMPTHSSACAGQDDEAPCICGTGEVMDRAYAAIEEATREEASKPSRESVRDAAARLGIPLTDHGLPPDVVRPAPFPDDSNTGESADLAARLREVIFANDDGSVSFPHPTSQAAAAVLAAIQGAER